MRRHPVAIWGVVLGCLIAPIVVAAMSPLLAWRAPIYIIAGFAGVGALSLLLLQPLLIGGYLPGLSRAAGPRVHRWGGLLLVLAVVLHVGGLWVTSPPDVVDALWLRSPTPFSLWGVIAMWAVFAAAVLAALRRRWRLSLRVWRVAHTGLAVVVVAGSVTHAVLIEGTMGQVSKAIICVCVLLATVKVVADRRVWKGRSGR